MLPDNFVRQWEDHGYIYQQYVADMPDPWRVKMIGESAAWVLTAIFIAWMSNRLTRAVAIAWAVFLLCQECLELTVANPHELWWAMEILLAMLLMAAFLWHKLGPKLWIAWRRKP